MGNYYNLFFNDEKTEFYESSEKIKKFISYPKLIVHPNFNFEDKNYSILKAKDLFEQSKKENQKEVKLSLLYKALNYHNTNGDIISVILKLETDQIKKKEILQKYGFYLSEVDYKLYFNKNKKSVRDLFKDLFDLFENFSLKPLDSSKRISCFVEEFCQTKFSNTFINENNKEEELIIYFILLVKEIARLIFSIKYAVYSDNKMSYEEKLEYYFTESEQDKIKELIKKCENNPKIVDSEKMKKDLMYINFKCFKSTFPSIETLLKDLKMEIISCLNDLNDSNFYIFICIKELISNILYNYDNSKNEKLIQKIKKLNTNKNQNNSLKEFIEKFNKKSTNIKIKEDAENKNNLIMINKNNYEFFESSEQKILNNVFIYDWDTMINRTSKLSINFMVPLEYQLLDYIKIEYMYKYNLIKYSIGFIEELTVNLCKSNTIISMLNTIYPGCEQIFNANSDFLSNLIKKVLNNSFYLDIFSFRAGTIFNPIEKINFFIINKFNGNLDSQQNYKNFLVVNLGRFIYIFHHEFFGHYILHYLSLLTTNKYNSPFSIIEKKGESGRFIETQLFGKRIDNLNLSQLLFILDINNYKNDFNTFAENFQKCENNLTVSKDLLDMFKRHFNIELKYKENENVESICLFAHDISFNNNIVMSIPSFNNCVPFNNIDFVFNLENLEKLKSN